MNWLVAILVTYAAIAGVIWLYLVIDEARQRKRVTCSGTVDALFCALLWPVILGIVVIERLGTWKRKRRTRQKQDRKP